MGDEFRRLIDDCDDAFELLPQPSDCVDDEAATSLSPPPIYTQLVCNTPQVGPAAPPPCTDSTWDLPPFELPFDDEICPRDRDNNDLDTLFSEVENLFDTEISPRELERYMDFTTPSSDTGSTYIQTSIYPTEEGLLSTFTGPFPTQAGPSHAGVCTPSSLISPSLIQPGPCETKALPNFQQLDTLATQAGPSRSENNIIRLESEKVKCYKCNKTFKRKQDFRRHVQTVHKEDPTIFKCDYCGVGFLGKDSLQMHMKKKHSESKPDMKECKQCKQAFSTKYALKRHTQRVHEPIDEPFLYQCDRCGKLFSWMASLKFHIKNKHSISIPDYTCSKCGRTFATAANMRCHSQFRCPSLREQPLLDTGDESAASAMEPGPSTALFRKPSNLDNRRFKCSKCGREYTRLNNMKRHQRYECGIPPQLSCPHCSSKFPRKDLLKQHITKRHGSENTQ